MARMSLTTDLTIYAPAKTIQSEFELGQLR